jgi:hypothetical protein
VGVDGIVPIAIGTPTFRLKSEGSGMNSHLRKHKNEKSLSDEATSVGVDGIVPIAIGTPTFRLKSEGSGDEFTFKKA